MSSIEIIFGDFKANAVKPFQEVAKNPYAIAVAACLTIATMAGGYSIPKIVKWATENTAFDDCNKTLQGAKTLTLPLNSACYPP